MSSTATHGALRAVVGLAALLNLLWFGVEFAVGHVIGSVSLFADSIDFLEDAALNFLILVAVGWSARNRARVGMLLAGLLLVPGVTTLATAWQKVAAPVAPDAALLSWTGVGALVVNLSCALILTPYRHHRGSLTRAAFLSARNDAFANVAIVAGQATNDARTALAERAGVQVLTLTERVWQSSETYTRTALLVEEAAIEAARIALGTPGP